MEDYSLYDNDSKRYVVQVSAAEARSLHVDHVKCFRLLNKLKAQGVQPTEDGMAHMPRSSSPEVSSSSGVDQPQNPQKTGANWRGRRTHSFLNACVPERERLRVKRVKDAVYMDIATRMIGLDPSLVYNHLQLREKMRTLKFSYSEAKKGKHGGEGWDHYWVMKHIFDEDLDSSDSPSSVLHQKTVAPQHSSFAQYLPVIPESDEFNGNDFTAVRKEGGDALSMLLLNDVPADDVIESFEVKSAFENEEVETSDPDMSGLTGEPLLSSTRLFEGAQVVVPGPTNNATFTGRKPLEVPMVQMLSTNHLSESNLRSPPKKKEKKSPSVVVGIHSPGSGTRSPGTAGKRKVSSNAALVWSADCTSAFLKACLARKDELCSKSVPVQTWKDILEDMKEANGGLTWSVCRERFNRMNTYFRETMLPVKGELGGILWPHYDAFCQIHDIPEDYYDTVVSFGGDEGDEDDEDVDGNDNGDGAHANINIPGTKTHKGKVWQSDACILLFIDLYAAKRHLFESSKSGLKHTYLFSKIAEELQDYGINVSGKQCMSKLSSLRSTFRQESDAQKKSGAAPSTWPFYQRMQDLDGGRPNIDAPVTVSVGRKLTYSVNGVKVSDQKRGSRTRPPAKPSSGNNAKSTKKPYKSRADELLASRARHEDMQRQALQYQDRITTAMERITSKQESSLDRRNTVLEDISATLKALLNK